MDSPITLQEQELARRWSGNQTIVRLEMSENALGADGVEARGS